MAEGLKQREVPPSQSTPVNFSSSVSSAEHGKTQLLILLWSLWKSGLPLHLGSDLALM